MKSPPQKGRLDDPRDRENFDEIFGRAYWKSSSEVNEIHRDAQRVSEPLALIIVDSRINFESTVFKEIINYFWYSILNKARPKEVSLNKE